MKMNIIFDVLIPIIIGILFSIYLPLYSNEKVSIRNVAVLIFTITFYSIILILLGII